VLERPLVLLGGTLGLLEAEHVFVEPAQSRPVLGFDDA
jgi:hypothetical protein